LREHHGPLGVAGDGAGQALEGAGRREGLFAAQVLDDALFGAAVLAHGLDQVEVGVAVDALLADEHGGLAAGQQPTLSTKIGVRDVEFSITHFLPENAGLMKSSTYTRENAKTGPALFKLSHDARRTGRGTHGLFHVEGVH